VNIGERIQSYLRRAAAGQPAPQFILFDLLPARACLSSAVSFAPHAMKMPRFLSLSHKLFRSEPLRLSESQIESITTYSARRVLPSIADSAGLSVTERLAVGAWADVAPDGSSMKVQAARMSMPTRYSEQKLVVASRIKSDLVARTKAALDVFTASNPSVKSPEWDDVLRCLPSRQERCALERSSAPVVRVEPMRLEQCALPSDGVVGVPMRPGQCAPPTSASDSADRSLVWAHTKARARMLHRARVSPSGAASSSVSSVHTYCGRTLTGCVVGYGNPPTNRVWRQYCTSATR